MPAISKLLFTPQDHQQSFPARTIIDGLTALVWLGRPFTQGPAQSFFVGETFFSYITFMGCAPSLRLEPQAEGDLNFCFVHINTELAEPQYRGHQEKFVPRCPECRHGLTQWQEQLAHWRVDDRSRFSCPHCPAQLSMPALNWREKAAIGRCFVEVYSVYPHEGIPTSSFLSHLKTITGVDWKYFYEPG